MIPGVQSPAGTTNFLSPQRPDRIWMFRKYIVAMWTGFIRLKIWTNDGSEPYVSIGVEEFLE
jgi:hypothetical protein